MFVFDMCFAPGALHGVMYLMNGTLELFNAKLSIIMGICVYKSTMLIPLV